jgi:hypothetical protein
MRSSEERFGIINPIVYGFIILQAVIIGFTTKNTSIPLMIILVATLTEWILGIILGKQGWITSTTITMAAVFLPVFRSFQNSGSLQLVSSDLLIEAVALGLGWLALLLLSWIRFKKVHWWMLMPALTLISLIYGVSSSAFSWLDLIFYTGLAVGMGLLIWGIGRKMFGLIIAGSIVLSMGTGIGFSWTRLLINSPVAQTGVMLVWFGLGWVLITISSRVIWDHFIWWPLIPGGVQVMVGAGTYIAGYLTQAQKGITNPIFISSFLFGIYIFIYRVGFRR